jgi:hypothetical protein
MDQLVSPQPHSDVTSGSLGLQETKPVLWPAPPLQIQYPLSFFSLFCCEIDGVVRHHASTKHGCERFCLRSYILLAEKWQPEGSDLASDSTESSTVRAAGSVP